MARRMVAAEEDGFEWQPKPNVRSWRAGDLVLLDNDNVSAGFYVDGGRAVPVFFKPADRDPRGSGRLEIADSVSVDEVLIVISVTRSREQQCWALVATLRGRIGFVHSNDVDILGNFTWRLDPDRPPLAAFTMHMTYTGELT